MYVYIWVVTILGDWVRIYSGMCHGTCTYANIRVNYYYSDGYYYGLLLNKRKTNIYRIIGFRIKTEKI